MPKKKLFRVSKEELESKLVDFLAAQTFKDTGVYENLPDHIELEGEEVRPLCKEYSQDCYSHPQCMEALKVPPPTGEGEKWHNWDYRDGKTFCTRCCTVHVPPPQQCCETCEHWKVKNPYLADKLPVIPFCECKNPDCPCHKREEKRHYDGGACDCVRPSQVEEKDLACPPECTPDFHSYNCVFGKVEGLPEEMIPTVARDGWTEDHTEMFNKINELVRYLRSRE